MSKLSLQNAACLGVVAMIAISCASPVQARSAQSFTSAIAVGKELLIAKKISETGEANSSTLILWDIGAGKLRRSFAIPETHKDVVEIFPSSRADEVFLLVQIRMAGTDRPDLLRLNLQSGAMHPVAQAVDCADLIGVVADVGKLNFSCGSETPFPPQKSKFTMSVPRILPNGAVKLKKGLKVGDAIIEQVNKDEIDEIAGLSFKVGKSAVKQLKASDVVGVAKSR